MSDTTLHLDSIAFQEFEIPESINGGGAQALFKHKYAGGLRTIDTMGPDDDDITWSGIFQNDTAQDRCKQLDILRRQGNQIVATWAGYQYLVVVAKFTWDLQRTWQIAYSITLAVVQDQTQPVQSDPEDVDSQTESDADDADTDADDISDDLDDVEESPELDSADVTTLQSTSSSLSTQVSGVLKAIASVPAISTATVNFQQALSSQVGAALSTAKNLQGNLDSAVTQAGNPSLFAGGTSPVAMAKSLSNLSSLAQAIASTVHCASALGRMSKNISLLGK